MFLDVSQAKIKQLQLWETKASICSKGSESGLIAARSLYIFNNFLAVMLVGHINCCDRLCRAKL